MPADNREPARGGAVSLRRFPYPYRAALAVTGDLDDLRTYADFAELTRFLCTEEATSLGRGLNLELSHSFWFFDPSSECEFTVFRGGEHELSPYADTIARLIRSRHLDVMHTYGDFSGGGFERSHAERALAFLRERGLSVPVWVNHGGRRNTQMIGPLPEQRGDDPDAGEYHTDLMTECGVQFVEMFEIVHTVGQDAPSTGRDRLVRVFESARYLLGGDIERARRALRNTLLSPCLLADGRMVYSFKRFIGRERGMGDVGSPELARQLSPAVLEELVAKGGWMSLYTHPWRNPASDRLIDPSAADALRVLAELAHGGIIYVTTTSRLLRTNLILGKLSWTSSESEALTTIEVDYVDDEVKGRWVPDEDDLSGATFYVPPGARARVLVAGSELEGLCMNPPDETGRSSVSIPIRRLPPPSLPSPAAVSRR